MPIATPDGASGQLMHANRRNFPSRHRTFRRNFPSPDYSLRSSFPICQTHVSASFRNQPINLPIPSPSTPANQWASEGPALVSKSPPICPTWDCLTYANEKVAVTGRGGLSHTDGAEGVSHTLPAVVCTSSEGRSWYQVRRQEAAVSLNRRNISRVGAELRRTKCVVPRCSVPTRGPQNPRAGRGRVTARAADIERVSREWQL
jgi:hypothetical protein